ncbi:rho GTPase-activating protein 5 [Andrographis paniculata]|uniref:rho GTPase-activating protein 5 n=1 Tax=Andrographis paniculata TaxID=175694 RepID=UPI0021E97994|nr:rho GTPase-activating protein 5 [Andrographis paniculata]
MTEVLHSHSSSSSPTHNATLFHSTQSYGDVAEDNDDDDDDDRVREEEKRESDRRSRDQLSLLALLLTLFRKTFWSSACKASDGSDAFSAAAAGAMEIGWPTDVQHVNHVTFDRFDGFLGLPVEFEPEVPRRPPSASATVFGVSTESMQMSYDARGNSIPTILLLLQRHLYSQDGLQAEGIFRITAGNSQDEFVREQLNRGVVPEGIDVHCLAGLIKAWFRELPRGVLDSLSSEQVMQCQSEDDCDALVRLLPATEAALLDWAVNLMADVVQEEHYNKMNSRNIAMVFAPNMTQMDDPLTALMYAVQVMNFLKTLIEKTLRERQDPVLEQASVPNMEPSDDNGHPSIGELDGNAASESNDDTPPPPFAAEDPDAKDYLSYSTSTEEESDGTGSSSEAPFLEKSESKIGGSPPPTKADNIVAVAAVGNLSRANSMTER